MKDPHSQTRAIRFWRMLVEYWGSKGISDLYGRIPAIRAICSTGAGPTRFITDGCPCARHDAADISGVD